MRIYGVSEQILNAALAVVNTKFDNNVMFKKAEKLTDSRGGGETWVVTLRVKDARGKGARRGFAIKADGDYRATISACWHVHGEFMDALPAGTRIFTGGRYTRSGDAWTDWNCGSRMHPVYMSDMCDC